MFLTGFFNTIATYTFFGFYNWMDVIIICIFGFYLVEGFQIGCILATLDFFSFILSFLVAIKMYNQVARLLSLIFPLPVGFANAIGFFLVALLIEVLANILFRHVIYRRLPAPFMANFHHRFKRLNQWLGIIPGFISASVVVSFLLTLVIAVPASPFLKTLASQSFIGSHFISLTTRFEAQINNIFGNALQETMSYLTVEPESKAFINLHFTVKNGVVDEQAEQTMLVMVNYERTQRGLDILDYNRSLTRLAENYGKDMFSGGYFSHYTPSGLSPFDRMNAAGIFYTSAGENLALAPTTDLAMEGLMNSPGHRANILSPNFHKVGIGVIDGGIYGKIYVQEFTD